MEEGSPPPKGGGGEERVVNRPFPIEEKEKKRGARSRKREAKDRKLVSAKKKRGEKENVAPTFGRGIVSFPTGKKRRLSRKNAPPHRNQGGKRWPI